MKNNKGFSLVELIIVIAIMAILIGVMAPQLIKYIEKTNVSNDTQICDTVRTAVQTAIMDPSVITDSTYVDVTGGASGAVYPDLAGLCTTAVSNKFAESICDSLGVPAGTAASGAAADTFLQTQMKSSGAKGTGKCSVAINTTSVIVYIKGTDNSGKKQTYNAPSTAGTGSCIYAGPVDSFGSGMTW